MSKPRLVLVVAVADNGVIGRDGKLPWKIPGDLKHFKELTMGKPVVMGRLTYESMGGPLQGRMNIVLTHNASYRAEGATVVTSLDQAMALAAKDAAAENTGEIAVIGGSVVFAETLPSASRLEITEVHGNPEGDTFSRHSIRTSGRKFGAKARSRIRTTRCPTLSSLTNAVSESDRAAPAARRYLGSASAAAGLSALAQARETAFPSPATVRVAH